MSFRVPYFRIYLEFFDKICGEFLGHIELAKYAIKRKTYFIDFHYYDVGRALSHKWEIAGSTPYGMFEKTSNIFVSSCIENFVILGRMLAISVKWVIQ